MTDGDPQTATLRRLRLTAIVTGPPEVLRLARRTAGPAGSSRHPTGLIVYPSRIEPVLVALRAAGHDVEEVTR